MTSQLEGSGSGAFEVTIDRDAEVPMGVQLGWALCASIQEGNFKPGQRLPALREMAETTGLNINTVRAVYQRLEQKGLIQSQQGSGTFVASKPSPRSELASIAAHAAHEARETGIDPREVAAALYVSGELTPSASDQAAARRHMLRTQIAVLERAIGEIEAAQPGAPPPSAARRPGPGPRLLGIDELEHVRTQLVRRLAVVQGAVDRHLGEADRERETERARATASRKAARARKPRAAKPRAPTKTKRTAEPRSATRPAPAGI